MAEPYDLEDARMHAMNTSQFGVNYDDYTLPPPSRPTPQPPQQPPRPMPSYEVFQAQFAAYGRFREANPGTNITFAEFQKNYKANINIQQAGSYKQKYLKYKQKYLILKNN